MIAAEWKFNAFSQFCLIFNIIFLWKNFFFIIFIYYLFHSILYIVIEARLVNWMLIWSISCISYSLLKNYNIFIFWLVDWSSSYTGIIIIFIEIIFNFLWWRHIMRFNYIDVIVAIRELDLSILKYWWESLKDQLWVLCF